MAWRRVTRFIVLIFKIYFACLLIPLSNSLLTSDHSSFGEKLANFFPNFDRQNSLDSNSKFTDLSSTPLTNRVNILGDYERLIRKPPSLPGEEFVLGPKNETPKSESVSHQYFQLGKTKTWLVRRSPDWLSSGIITASSGDPFSYKIIQSRNHVLPNSFKQNLQTSDSKSDFKARKVKTRKKRKKKKNCRNIKKGICKKGKLPKSKPTKRPKKVSLHHEIQPPSSLHLPTFPPALPFPSGPSSPRKRPISGQAVPIDSPSIQSNLITSMPSFPTDSHISFPPIPDGLSRSKPPKISPRRFEAVPTLPTSLTPPSSIIKVESTKPDPHFTTTTSQHSKTLEEPLFIITQSPSRNFSIASSADHGKRRFFNLTQSVSKRKELEKLLTNESQRRSSRAQQEPSRLFPLRFAELGRKIQSRHKGFNSADIPDCAKAKLTTFCTITEDQLYPSKLIKEKIEDKMDFLEEIWHPTSSFLYNQLEKKKIHFIRRHSNAINGKASNANRICPSSLQRAKISRAKNTRGEWKLIVNAMDEPKYSQVVLLEECLSPGTQCKNVKGSSHSNCFQKHSNHNLLSWTKDIGFHVDSFSLPTSCQCKLKSRNPFRTFP